MPVDQSDSNDAGILLVDFRFGSKVMHDHAALSLQTSRLCHSTLGLVSRFLFYSDVSSLNYELLDRAEAALLLSISIQWVPFPFTHYVLYELLDSPY